MYMRKSFSQSTDQQQLESNHEMKRDHDNYNILN